MKLIAHVKEIWRYPVKSMGGETLDRSTLTTTGMAGDRQWAVVDADGEIKSARQWPKLVQMRARYLDTRHQQARAYVGAVPDIVVSIPEAGDILSRASETNSALAQFLDQPCRLEPLRPPTDAAFYTPSKARNRDNLDTELDKLDDEGEFDFSQTPDEIFAILGQYMTPPGTFFDSLPLHLLSTQSMAHLADSSSADANPRRFRPNLYLDFADADANTPEFNLLGKRIRIGEAVINICAKTIRCSIPSRPQPLLGLAQDPNMTRAMVQLFARHIGVYAYIETGGVISVGDPVLLDGE